MNCRLTFIFTEEESIIITKLKAIINTMELTIEAFNNLLDNRGYDYIDLISNGKSIERKDLKFLCSRLRIDSSCLFI